jgi:hypothetical protein
LEASVTAPSLEGVIAMPRKTKAAKPARGGNPANLEKTRAQTKSHLRKGGKKERELSIPELEYCAWRAQGVAQVDAAEFAGIAKGNTYRLEQREITQQTIKEIKDEYRSGAIDRVAQMREEFTGFVFGQYRLRLRKMRTHHFRGDESIQRMIETGFKAAGLIQPQKTINQQVSNDNRTTTNQLYAKRLYLPDWRRETIEGLQKKELQAANESAKNESAP